VDDPARARVQQPGHRAYIEAAQLRTGLRLELEDRLGRLPADEIERRYRADG